METRSNIRLLGFIYLIVLMMLMGLFAYRTAHATLQPNEPEYCEPAGFTRFQLKYQGEPGKPVSRLKAFRLGRVIVAGMAIGNSDASAVQAVSNRLRTGQFGERNCTWYLNKGNVKAEKIFSHRYLPNPTSLNTDTGPQIYMNELGSEFRDQFESFTSCAENAGYIGLGCNGQRHRGPTVFGMILAYSGCSPQNAARIVNQLWGLNGVAPEVREEIIRAGYEKGIQQPETRNRLQTLFLATTPTSFALDFEKN